MAASNPASMSAAGSSTLCKCLLESFVELRLRLVVFVPPSIRFQHALSWPDALLSRASRLRGNVRGFGRACANWPGWLTRIAGALGIVLFVLFAGGPTWAAVAART